MPTPEGVCRCDQVARLKCECRRAIGDLLPDIVDELAGLAVLPDFAIDQAAKLERVGDLGFRPPSRSTAR